MMANTSVWCVGLAVLLVALFSEIDAGVRVARSPQFGGGGFSQANAQAQAGAGGFGGGFGPQYPRPYPYGGFGRPHFGGGGFGQGGFHRPGFGSGGSISISKSISISRGGASQSSAGSSAGASGK